ncbi:MAG TPA: CCA tRNA nucleotidyltransferase [Candidatus Bathyarchaeia archaeon]|nr:CCA tRNA nucleotidyltransferase [Candidatus Bathyarchaeia archaeon]
MPTSIDQVLTRVAKRVVPTHEEREKIARLSQRFSVLIAKILTDAGFDAEVSVQGSVARDTWLRGEGDLDFFARFPPTMPRDVWTNNVLPIIRANLRDYRIIERYTEHPFLEFHDEGVLINIVPSYKVEKGQWKSATDRTPFHTEYMKSHLTPEMRLEARLLRRFMKGIQAYGAEIRVGGFSGMLTETLILYHGSFQETLGQASDWKAGVFIDVEKNYQNLQGVPERLQSDLVVIDPVDPERNLAASVRPTKLWSFVVAAQQFMKTPGLQYFYPRESEPRSKLQFRNKVEASGYEIAVVAFKHSPVVVDVLWGQLMRLEKSLIEMMERNDFEILRSDVWSDEKRNSIIIFETGRTRLPQVRRHQGPPVWNKIDGEAFLHRHWGVRDTIRGPWPLIDRWVVDKKRRAVFLRDLLALSIRDKSYGLVVPAQLEEGFRKTAKLLEAKEVLALLNLKGFGKTLWQFMEARPSWLTKSRS